MFSLFCSPQLILQMGPCAIYFQRKSDSIASSWFNFPHVNVQTDFNLKWTVFDNNLVTRLQLSHRVGWFLMKAVKGLHILYDFLTQLKVGDDKLQFLRFSKPESKLFALTLNAPIATKVVCFSRLLKCLRSLYGKQCGPRSDCSYRSSLIWVHPVCFYTK